MCLPFCVCVFVCVWIWCVWQPPSVPQRRTSKAATSLEHWSLSFWNTKIILIYCESQWKFSVIYSRRIPSPYYKRRHSGSVSNPEHHSATRGPHISCTATLLAKFIHSFFVVINLQIKLDLSANPLFLIYSGR